MARRTRERVVERGEAVADRQARDQPVGDARRLVGALPQHVLQQQAVVAAHRGAPARVRRHLSCTRIGSQGLGFRDP